MLRLRSSPLLFQTWMNVKRLRDLTSLTQFCSYNATFMFLHADQLSLRVENDCQIGRGAVDHRCTPSAPRQNTKAGNPHYLLQHDCLLLLEKGLELLRRQDLLLKNLLHLLRGDHLGSHHGHRHGHLDGERKRRGRHNQMSAHLLHSYMAPPIHSLEMMTNNLYILFDNSIRVPQCLDTGLPGASDLIGFYLYVPSLLCIMLNGGALTSRVKKETTTRQCSQYLIIDHLASVIVLSM